MFADRLTNEISRKNNPTVMGLDPKLEYIPDEILRESFEKYGENLKGAAEAVLGFNRRLLESTHDLIPAVKPQLAYYEMYGPDGINTFQETVKYAKELGLIVIADGKRNDIGSTAGAYSSAYLGRTKITEKKDLNAYSIDALTVNPYLGIDGIQPFIDDCIKEGKGIFILVKTSNSSSGDFQDVETKNGEKMFELVAKKVEMWGRQVKGKSGYSSIGAVVGATYPKEALILRKLMRNTIFLVPGYGAQGGGAKDIIPAFNKGGKGAIVNSSRGIMCAYKNERWKSEFLPENFDKAARAEVIRMRDDINNVLKIDMK